MVPNWRQRNSIFFEISFMILFHFQSKSTLLFTNSFSININFNVYSNIYENSSKFHLQCQLIISINSMNFEYPPSYRNWVHGRYFIVNNMQLKKNIWIKQQILLILWIFYWLNSVLIQVWVTLTMWILWIIEEKKLMFVLLPNLFHKEKKTNKNDLSVSPMHKKVENCRFLNFQEWFLLKESATPNV